MPEHLLVLGRRLHRPGVRPDVPPLRQPRHRRPARRAAADPRGRGRRRGGRRISCAKTASRSCWTPTPSRVAGGSRRRRARRSRTPAGERTLTRLAPARRRRSRTRTRDALNLDAAGRGDRRARLHPGRTTGWRRTSPASTPWATSRAARPSRISPTTTTASCATNLLDGGNATIAGPAGALHGLHRPAAGPRRPDRAGGKGAGPAVRVAKMPMSSVARALEMDEARGFMKAIVDAQTQQILGCAILAARAARSCRCWRSP